MEEVFPKALSAAKLLLMFLTAMIAPLCLITIFSTSALSSACWK